MTSHRWVELDNTRLGYKEYIIKPSLCSQYLTPSTRPELQSMYWFYFYEGFFSYHKTIPYMVFQFFVQFLMWKDRNSLDIPSRGDQSWEEDNSFFTGQIRGDINKPERRPIKTDIKRRTALTGTAVTSKQLSAPSFLPHLWWTVRIVQQNTLYYILTRTKKRQKC